MTDTQNSAPRTGVILAAGLGTRLREGPTSNALKPLASVADTSLVIRTLNSLEIAGCSTIVVVLGFHADELREVIGGSYGGSATLEFVTNHKYELKNGISVLCARDHVSDPFILTMADHVLDDAIMHLAREHTPPKDGATLLVDYKLDTIFDMDDATKVVAVDGKIVEISKQLTEFNCVDTGVFVCTPQLMDEIEKVYDATGDASLSDGVGALARRGCMHVLDIGDAFWQDVDTPEMLAHAELILRERRAAFEAERG